MVAAGASSASTFFAEVGHQRRIGTAIKGRARDHFQRVGARGSEIDLVGDDPGRRLFAHRRRDLAHHAVGVAQAGDIRFGIGDAVDLVIVDEQHRDRAGGAAVRRDGKRRLRKRSDSRPRSTSYSNNR